MDPQLRAEPGHRAFDNPVCKADKHLAQIQTYILIRAGLTNHDQPRIELDYHNGAGVVAYWPTDLLVHIEDHIVHKVR